MITVIFIIVLGLAYHAFEQEKRFKVQDRQFRSLLARLNELTGREQDDFSSPLDGDTP
jgi:predicted SprT family Zn-dependent metalloprotease